MDARALWIVIPAYNETSRLGSLLQAIKVIHPSILVIDDGSSDNTASIARKHAPHVLSHPINLGKGAAMKTGAQYAFSELQAQAVIFMDADGQHLPDDIPLFIKALKQGHQLVFGIRDFGPSMPWVRRRSNQTTSMLVQLLFGHYLPDIPSGFKAMTKDAYTKVYWHSSDYAVELEIAVNTVRSHLDYQTVPIHTIYYPTLRGMTALDAVKSGIKIISWRLSV